MLFAAFPARVKPMKLVLSAIAAALCALATNARTQVALKAKPGHELALPLPKYRYTESDVPLSGTIKQTADKVGVCLIVPLRRTSDSVYRHLESVRPSSWPVVLLRSTWLSG